MARQPFRFTPEQEAEILRAYAEGLTANVIAQQGGYPYGAVRRLLTAHGYRLQMRCGTSKRRRRVHVAIEALDREKILALYEKGYTAMDIARMEGYYYPAVRRFLRQEGYYLYQRSGRKGKVLSESDAQKAEELYRQHHSVVEIAELLHYPVRVIREHLQAVGIYRLGKSRSAVKGYVSAEEAAEMVHLFQSGLSAGKIAKQLGRSTSVVCRHLARAGIKLVDKRSGLAPERKALIRQLAEERKTIAQIARETGHSPAVIKRVLAENAEVEPIEEIMED